MLTKFTLDDVCETLRASPASVAVFSVEPEDRFVIRVMSPALEALYGVPPGGADGLEVDQFRFDDDTRRRLKETYRKCRDSGVAVTMDEEIRRPDGSRVWTSRTVVPLIDASGRVVALVSTVIDVTELVATRRALMRTLSATAAGLVTICAWCSKVKEDDVWTALDAYVARQSDPDAVLCPRCQKSVEGGKEPGVTSSS